MTANTKEQVLVAHRTSQSVARETDGAGLRKHAARGVWAGGLILIMGNFLDLGVLWGLQFQGSPQWEFVAAINTLEAYTRFSIGVALIYAALHIGAETAFWKYRAAAGFMLVLGLVAVALGLVLLNDYFVLARLVQEQTEASGALIVTVTKGLLLSGLFALVFIPLGILGLRRPRTT